MFIINPVACGNRKTRRITEAVSDVLSGVGGFFEVRQSSSGEDAVRLAREACQQGYEAVFACGGDGTANLIGSVLVNTRTSLGIIPTGSGNGLARALGIPLNIEWAVSVLKKGRLRRIDVGRVGGRYFFSTAGIGLDAASSKRYNDWAGLYPWRGLLPYVPIVLAEWLLFRNEPIMLRCGEKRLMSVSPVILTVANTREYGGGAVIAPDAEPDDGLFDVCVIEKTGFIRALGLARRIFKNGINSSSYVQIVRAPWVSVVRDNPGPAHVDGEPFRGGKKLRFTLLPQALKVWAF